MKKFLMLATIAVLAGILASGIPGYGQGTPGETITDKREESTINKLMTEVNSDRQRDLALAFMTDEPWSRGRDCPANTEIISMLRDPRVGYMQGRKMAAILNAAGYGLPKKDRPIAPIIDMTTNLKQSGWWKSGNQDVVGVLSYELHLCCHQERDWKDTLFVYWRGKVHEILHNGVGGISFQEGRYVVIKTFVLGYVAGPASLEDALELWILDTETNLLSLSMHLTLSTGEAQMGAHTILYGFEWRDAGDGFRPVVVYYREDTGLRTLSQPVSNSYVVNSPYFLQDSFEFDRSSLTYKLSQHKKIEGIDYLKVISTLSDNSGKIKSFAGEEGIEMLFMDFRVYQKNGDALLRKAKPLLNPAAQKAVTTVLSQKRPNQAL